MDLQATLTIDGKLFLTKGNFSVGVQLEEPSLSKVDQALFMLTLKDRFEVESEHYLLSSNGEMLTRQVIDDDSEYVETKDGLLAVRARR